MACRRERNGRRAIPVGLGILLLAVLAPAPPPAVGAVGGTVRLLASAPNPPAMLSPYARPRYRPPARSEGGAGSPETVVVYLRSAGRAPAGARTPVEIVQRGRTILPHVTAIEAGTRVEFPNSDDVFHNIFSLSGPRRFNLGRYPPGESRAIVFDQPGIVRLFCDIHSEMGGVIVVLDTPYFTKPDADGRFQIAGVPDGTYTAIVWHEAAGMDSAQVVVSGGAEARVDFVLGG